MATFYQKMTGAHPFWCPNASNATADGTAVTAHDAAQQTDFGRLGIALFLVAWVCIGWTVWLTSLAASPSDAMNQAMRTEDFGDDDLGDFWGVIGPRAATKALGVVGFVLVLAGYFYVLLKLFFWQQSSRMVPSQPQLPSSPSRSSPQPPQRPRVQLSDSFENARRKSIVQSSLKVKTELERGGNSSLLKNTVLMIRRSNHRWG